MEQRQHEGREQPTLALRERASREDLLLEIDRLRAELLDVKRVSRLKDEQLSMASHELATPLTSLKAYVDALLENWGDPAFDKAHEFLLVLQRETARLTRVVERTLQAARGRAQAEGLQQTQFDICLLIADVSTALAPFLQERGIQLAMDAPDKLPPVVADRDLLGQVLINLVHNAAKFSSPGRTVDVRVEFTPGTFNLQIHDEGSGVDSDELGRVFDPYFRGRRQSTRMDEGTGLGLAIVKRIVEQHGGSIHVESVVDVGTSFFLSFPQP